MTSRLLIEYDGREFRGWAKQPGQRTVQEELEKALSVVRRERTVLTVAGRTDSGVHAWGQVASHAGEPAAAGSLNALLPDDITVLESSLADDDFDARASATSRTYCYRIWNRGERPALLRERVLWYAYPIQFAKLEVAAELIVGENDFEAFTTSEQPYRSYRRAISRAEWVRRERLIEFWITGESFTRRMVRALVGFQLEIARGKRNVEEFADLLAGARRQDSGATAAACGLYLAEIGFDAPPPRI